jgi:hypothetical protein
MRRPDDCSLTPGQRLRVRKEAERALREAGALDVFPTPIDRIMAVAANGLAIRTRKTLHHRG